MVDWKKETKRRLFGLHPGKTADYIRRLKQLQAEELEALHRRLGREESETEELRRAAEALEADLAKKRERERQFHGASERLESSVRAIRALGETEANALVRQSERKEAEHRERLSRVEEQSRAYEDAFSELIEELYSLLGKVERLDEAAERTVSKAVVSAVGGEANLEQMSSFWEEAASASAEPVGESEPEAAPEPAAEADLVDRQRQELAALHQTAKVIQFKLRNLVEKRETEPKESNELPESSAVEREANVQPEPSASPEEEVEAEAEERAASNESREEEAERTELAAASSWGASSPSPRLRARAPKPAKARRDSKPSAFWGDVQDYLNVADDADEEEFEAAEEGRKSDFFDAPPKRSEEARPAETVVPRQESRHVAPQPKPAPAAIQGNAPAAPGHPGAAVSAKPSLESPALSGEIAAIRNRYIVGKLAGEALYGQDGRLIVGKNQRITPKVVQEADLEGKLADLIVHMVIPSAGEGNES